jgi:hypothetical protein
MLTVNLLLDASCADGINNMHCLPEEHELWDPTLQLKPLPGAVELAKARRCFIIRDSIVVRPEPFDKNSQIKIAGGVYNTVSGWPCQRACHGRCLSHSQTTTHLDLQVHKSKQALEERKRAVDNASRRTQESLQAVRAQNEQLRKELHWLQQQTHAVGMY